LPEKPRSHLAPSETKQELQLGGGLLFCRTLCRQAPFAPIFKGVSRDGFLCRNFASPSPSYRNPCAVNEVWITGPGYHYFAVEIKTKATRIWRLDRVHRTRGLFALAGKGNQGLKRGEQESPLVHAAGVASPPRQESL